MKQANARSAAVLLMLLMVLMAFGAYVGGYFFLGKCHDFKAASGEPFTWRVRIFKSEWLASSYQPVAKVESLLTGLDVDLVADP